MQQWADATVEVFSLGFDPRLYNLETVAVKNVYSVYIYMLSNQQLITDKMYYSIEKTNPSSYRRGGPLPNSIGVIYENKNMVLGPDWARHKNNHAGKCQQ
jgi:hypothetical protein